MKTRTLVDIRRLAMDRHGSFAGPQVLENAHPHLLDVAGSETVEIFRRFRRAAAGDELGSRDRDDQRLGEFAGNQVGIGKVA